MTVLARGDQFPRGRPPDRQRSAGSRLTCRSADATGVDAPLVCRRLDPSPDCRTAARRSTSTAITIVCGPVFDPMATRLQSERLVSFRPFRGGTGRPASLHLIEITDSGLPSSWQASACVPPLSKIRRRTASSSVVHLRRT
jgi:hypothetical protein